MIDWQTGVVALIVLAALAYVGRRGWRRVRSFSARRSNEAGCATGCGNCPDSKTEPAPRTVLVGISRTKSASR